MMEVLRSVTLTLEFLTLTFVFVSLVMATYLTFCMAMVTLNLLVTLKKQNTRLK